MEKREDDSILLESLVGKVTIMSERQKKIETQISQLSVPATGQHYPVITTTPDFMAEISQKLDLQSTHLATLQEVTSKLSDKFEQLGQLKSNIGQKRINLSQFGENNDQSVTDELSDMKASIDDVSSAVREQKAEVCNNLTVVNDKIQTVRDEITDSKNKTQFEMTEIKEAISNISSVIHEQHNKATQSETLLTNLGEKMDKMKDDIRNTNVGIHDEMTAMKRVFDDVAYIVGYIKTSREISRLSF